jgi:hypothetical protein
VWLGVSKNTLFETYRSADELHRSADQAAVSHGATRRKKDHRRRE